MTTGTANQNLVPDLSGQCNIDARYLTENGKQKENEPPTLPQKRNSIVKISTQKNKKTTKYLYLIKLNVPYFLFL